MLAGSFIQTITLEQKKALLAYYQTNIEVLKKEVKYVGLIRKFRDRKRIIGEGIYLWNLSESEKQILSDYPTINNHNLYLYYEEKD